MWVLPGASCPVGQGNGTTALKSSYAGVRACVPGGFMHVIKHTSHAVLPTPNSSVMFAQVLQAALLLRHGEYTAW